MMPEQQQRILGYFIEEAKDHLNTIEQGLLNLQATIQDPEMMSEVFRAAHSVKGGAAMLSLDSIQLTSHRLEDYFKILKETPSTQIDRPLESMFLQIFDGLQALLEELQGPFGLTEDKAKEVMADVEPVFDQLEHHLNQLVAQADAAPAIAPPRPAAVAAPPPRVVASSEDSALKLVFSSDVPGHLRDMLTLFKQADTAASRAALQASCESLKRIGEQFDLSLWRDLATTTYQAVGNAEQTYRTLAPIVIKELKRAQEQVLSGQARAITVSQELEALLPAVVEIEDSIGDIDSFLDEALSTTDEPDLADLFETEAQPVTDAAGDFDWLDLSPTEAATTAPASRDDLVDAIDTLAAGDGGSSAPAAREPIVGAAELNSLADLFEGEVSGLESPWEEISESEAAIAAPKGADIDITDDFSDLLDESMEEGGGHESSAALLDLFGDTDAFDEPPQDLGAIARDTTANGAEGGDFDDLFNLSEGTDDIAPEAVIDALDTADDALDHLLDSFAEEAPEPTDDLDATDLDLDLETDDDALDELDDLFGTDDGLNLAAAEGAESVSLSPSEAPSASSDTTDDESFDAIADPWSAEDLDADLSEDSALDALDELWTESHPATGESTDGPSTASDADIFAADDADIADFDPLADLDLATPDDGSDADEALADLDLAIAGDEADTAFQLDDLLDESDSDHELADFDLAVTGDEPDTAFQLDDLLDEPDAEDELPDLDLAIAGDEPSTTLEFDDLLAESAAAEDHSLNDLFNAPLPDQAEADLFTDDAAVVAVDDITFDDLDAPGDSATDGGDAEFDALFEAAPAADDRLDELDFDALSDGALASGADDLIGVEADDLTAVGDDATAADDADFLANDADFDDLFGGVPAAAAIAETEAVELFSPEAEADGATPVLEAEADLLDDEFDGLLDDALGDTAATGALFSDSDQGTEDEAQSWDIAAGDEALLGADMGLGDTAALVADDGDGHPTPATDDFFSTEAAPTVTTADDDFFGDEGATAIGAVEDTTSPVDWENELFAMPAAPESEVADTNAVGDIDEFFETPAAPEVAEAEIAATPDDLTAAVLPTTPPATDEFAFLSADEALTLDADLPSADDGEATDDLFQSSSADIAADFDDFDDLLAATSTETSLATDEAALDEALLLADDGADFLAEVAPDSTAETVTESTPGLVEDDQLDEAHGLDEPSLDFDLDDLIADGQAGTSDLFDEPIGDTFDTAAAESASPFDDLEALLGDSPAIADEGSSTSTGADFDELADLLSDDAADVTVSGAAAGDVDFDELDALLGDDIAEPEAIAEPDESEPADEFGDLEKLLEEADQTLGGGSPSLRSAGGRSTRRVGGMVDQTMRVSVKHLDNLNNLVGELVVNRNSLEQDQDRLRQFLDNLLFQVQQLNDVGQRMRDLYERSLLESSLLASRQAFQSGGLTRTLDSHGGNGGSHATGATFDALEMDRFTGFHTLTQEMIELIVRVRESASDIAYTVESTDQIARQFRQVTTQLQEGLNKARMVPFAQTADRLPRAVRDISIKCGKEARLVVEGRDTLIDKMILERLYDPMTHLVNNAITHGIETPEERAAVGKPREGTITVRAFYQGNQTVIYIADDGAGINPNVVKRKAIQKGLITQTEADAMNTLETYEILFRHGFSTRDKADDFAGRGVGMDVVRTALSEIRGSITIDSEMGKGTSFTIRLPLTLSISKALSCLNNQARIAFPMDGVEDMFDVPRERIQTDENNQTYIQWRDTLLTFQPLSDLLHFNRALGRGRVYGGTQDEDIVSIVVLRNANTYIGIQVDRVLGEQEIVIKQIEGPIPKPMGIAGATVLGDGRVMPIGDVLELIDIAQGRVRREAGSSLWSQVELPPEEDVVATKAEPTVLIVDDSITVRELLSMSFNKVGYRVEQARDGQEAWEKMRSGLPCDLVFCDIEMPRMDGLELLSRMQKDSALKQIPIAMLTSRGADRHRQMAVDLGASGYFTKPYLEEALLDAAQRMLNGEVLLNRVEVEE